jgi:adenosylcobyric acid synthase
MAQAGIVSHVALPNSLGWHNARGNVLGVYLHGLFEDAAAVQALFGAGRAQPVRTLDSVFDGLADYVASHFAPGVLDALIRH